MKILVLIDKLNWAYHSIAKALVKNNHDPNLSLHIEHIKGNRKTIKKIYKKFDLFFVMGWQTFESVDFLPKDKIITGLHSHHSWDDKKTTPEKNVNPPSKLIDNLNSFIRVNAVSKKLYDLFKSSGVENISYTPNGADTDIFKPSSRNNDVFTVGYSGTQTHDWRKGISDFILPAAKKAGVKVELAMRATEQQVSVEEMPAFYQKLDAYICASSSEGFSLSVLEAASCGNPIITTNVGGMAELIKDGNNGFLVKKRCKRNSR